MSVSLIIAFIVVIVIYYVLIVCSVKLRKKFKLYFLEIKTERMSYFKTNDALNYIVLYVYIYFIIIKKPRLASLLVRMAIGMEETELKCYFNSERSDEPLHLKNTVLSKVCQNMIL